MNWKQQPYRSKSTDIALADELQKAIKELPAGQEIALEVEEGQIKSMLSQVRRWLREHGLLLTASVRKDEANRIFIFHAKPRKKKDAAE